MSVENLKEYARRCVNEPALHERAKQLGLQDLDGQMREAASLGLDWNQDDLTAFSREMVEAEGEIKDLSEEDLEKVAGGIALGLLVAALVAGVVGAAVVGVVGGVVAGEHW